MSISPPSDIVLDVLKAANPLKSSAAALKLQSLAASAGNARPAPARSMDNSQLWSRRLEEAGSPHAPARQAGQAAAAPAAAALDATAAPQAARLHKTFKKLEGVFLQGVIASMLSASKGGLYGKGLAGAYWKSLLAESIAGQIADGGGVGVAEALQSAAAGKLLREGGSPVAAKQGGAIARADEGMSYRLSFEKKFLNRLDSGTVFASSEANIGENRDAHETRS